MIGLRARADLISQCWRNNLVDVGAIEREILADRKELLERCAALADSLAYGISMGTDRLRDYDRGALATAHALARQIRSLEISKFEIRNSKLDPR